MAQTPLTWDGRDAQGRPLLWDAAGLTWDGSTPKPKGRTMQYAKVLLSFTRAKDHVVEETAGAVIRGMTDNPAYPTPPVTMVALQAALTAFTAAIAAQVHGGTEATLIKNDKREALVALLRELAIYVQQECNNDMTTLVSSGFEGANYSHAQSELQPPVIVSVTNGISGELRVVVNAVLNAKSYEVRYAVVAAGGVPGAWQVGGIFTDSRCMKVNGLTPGTMYQLQVRAVGGTTGYSGWSNGQDRMSL